MTKKILVVEDRDSHRMMIVDKLEFAGYDVVSVISFEGAKEVLDKEKIDLITLDLRIPPNEGGTPDKEVGYNFLSFIRKDEDTKGIPVCVITVLGDDEDMKKSKELGARCHIRKPFDPDDLVKKVKGLLGDE